VKKTWVAVACLTLGAAGPVAAAAPEQNPPIDITVLHAQVILDHLGFSPGVIDGKRGQSLISALKGFQMARGLQQSGDLDAPTMNALRVYRAMRPIRQLRLSADALAGPYINPLPHDPAKQAKLPAMGYRGPMEKLAEMFHTTPAVLVALNAPGTRLSVGTLVNFPNALPSSRHYDPALPADWRQTLSMLNVDAAQQAGSKIVVDKSDSVLRVYNRTGALIAQFPATMGSRHDPLPLGTWKIQGVSYNPQFHYNPSLFWDAKRSAKDALLPPGPNGPVGVVWLDLSKPHYGIHGTPAPETIGRAESHGCIRLSNWDAARLALMVKPGTPAIFQK
jgi:lipoprotein-anchoring transpeptidase ErfK/SrfK